MSQDDCRHDAFSCAWAAINGKPLSEEYFYDIDQLKAGDLPPDVYYLGKTLGSTDGAGNEVRFSFLTTLSPEWEWMDAGVEIHVGYTRNYYRFFIKSGLTWRNVIEMLNYGTGIAFHNVNIQSENNVDTIRDHYSKAQGIITGKPSDRGCKVLAEPDGNKAYVSAARGYDPIQIMTAQSGAEAHYPFRVNNDLHHLLLSRDFTEIETIKAKIRDQLRSDKKDRKAVQIGIHGAGKAWAEFLLWMNDTHGKDGDDSVWFMGLEEYYEYNYYRVHGSVKKSVSGNTLKLTVSLPSGQYFYYPSLTVNLKGIDTKHITSITSGNTVTGLSYGACDEGTMINIDCRKFLVEHADNFVKRYEADKTEPNRKDAFYFVNMLKDSDKKASF